MQLARDSTFMSASCYQLVWPIGKVSDPVPLPAPTCEGVGQTSSFRLPDAFRQRGLGRSAHEVLSVLESGPLAVKIIAEKTGRHLQTVRISLARMQRHGLVERNGRIWRTFAPISELDLDALAKDVGTQGAGARQREKHLVERVRHKVSNFILRKQNGR